MARFFRTLPKKNSNGGFNLGRGDNRWLPGRVEPATVRVVFNEVSLRYIVGTPKVMAVQLHHLANMPANASVRI
ncbi:Scr1 family TA system antitoxin-like transcriptional regulator [Nocardia sp. NPDC049220]|uniref:Scr1 family TA system antitoxin-like transcriptional regulator n=1 Tax=Nocardia sp. NPDC049220 TaxID=3155273 RepID=UPI0033DC769E